MQNLQIHFIGTVITDNESQCLTCVIDRLLLIDSITNNINCYRALTGEFLIFIYDNNKNSWQCLIDPWI